MEGSGIGGGGQMYADAAVYIRDLTRAPSRTARGGGGGCHVRRLANWCGSGVDAGFSNCRRIPVGFELMSDVKRNRNVGCVNSAPPHKREGD